MSESTYILLQGLLMCEMINTKDRESQHFKDVVKADKELKELEDVQCRNIQST